MADFQLVVKQLGAYKCIRMISKLHFFLLIQIFSSMVVWACSSHVSETSGVEPPIENLPSPDLRWEKRDPILNDSCEYVIIIGDIQKYTLTEYNACKLTSLFGWIEAQKKFGVKVKLILQTGDITDNNAKNEWENFKSALINSGLSVPMITCTGNHDYPTTSTGFIKDRSASWFKYYVLYENQNKDVHAIDFKDHSSENVFFCVNILGQRYLLLSLELGVGKSAYTWAEHLIKSNPHDKFILLTHIYLSPTELQYYNGDKYSAKFYFQSDDCTDGFELWRDLVKPNDNIKMVVCGHSGFTKKLISKNDKKNDVVQIMFNIHERFDWLQIMEFNSGRDSVRLITYNPYTKTTLMDENSNFVFKKF